MVELTVLEAYGRDVGRGIARIDYDIMDLLKIKTGDTIRISTKKWTIAKALPLYPSDEGKHVIRIDKQIRNNSGVLELSQKVDVTPITVSKIVAISLEPIDDFDRSVLESLTHPKLVDIYEGQCLKSGDCVTIPWLGTSASFNVGKIKSEDGSQYGIVTLKTVFITPSKTTEELTRADVLKLHKLVLETRRGIDEMERRINIITDGWKK